MSKQIRISEDNPETIKIKIPGLREIQPGIFEMSGVAPRYINYQLLQEAIGIADDVLAEKIVDLVYRHDIAKILTDKIVAA